MKKAYNSPEYFHCVSDPHFRNNVYEPEADTFLFLEALDRDAERLQKARPQRCVEIGCGSGTVISHLWAVIHLASLSTPLTKNDDDDVKRNVEEGTEGVSPKTEDALTPADDAAIAVKDACLLPAHASFFAVDVNPAALQAAALTWEKTLRAHFRPVVRAYGALAGMEELAAALLDIEGSFATPPLVLVTTSPSSSPSSPLAICNSSKKGATNDGDVTMPKDDDEGSCAAVETAAHSQEVGAALHPCYLTLLHGDLFSPFDVAPQCSASGSPEPFDVVLFNPPYVPTSMEELEDAVRQRDVITAAWCGGPRGRVVLDRFLEELPRWLSRSGSAYVVLIKENGIDEVIQYVHDTFRRHAGVEGRDVVEMVCVAERFTGEYLSVHRITFV